ANRGRLRLGLRARRPREPRLDRRLARRPAAVGVVVAVLDPQRAEPRLAVGLRPALAGHEAEVALERALEGALAVQAGQLLLRLQRALEVGHHAGPALAELLDRTRDIRVHRIGILGGNGGERPDLGVTDGGRPPLSSL